MMQVNVYFYYLFLLANVCASIKIFFRKNNTTEETEIPTRGFKLKKAHNQNVIYQKAIISKNFRL